MKKIISFILLCVCSMGFFIGSARAVDLPEITDHEKVKIYIFRSYNCTYCHSFIEYFSDKAIEYKDYFEIISYEVGLSATNSSLKSKIVEELDVTDGSKVPLIVIGDNYKIGFGNSSGSEIIEQALNEYQNEDYVDIVAQTIEEEDIEHDPETFMEACESANVDCIDENNVDDFRISDGTIILIIFIVIIGGFVLLMVTSKKKS